MTNKCQKCGVLFSNDEASVYDPLNYCRVCLRNFRIVRDFFYKKDEVTDEEGNTEILSRRRTRHWLEGEDWMFCQFQVGQLSDEELRATIEFNREYYSLLQAEDAKRLMEKAHAKAAKAHKALAQAQSHVVKTTETTIKQTTHVKTAASKLSQFDKLAKQILGVNLADLQSTRKTRGGE
jgi:hypothetical protein